MAGITAFIRYQSRPPLLDELLRKALWASYPLPDLKSVTAPTNCPEVALGGTYPKHFHREAEAFKLGNTALLFYGELYNDLHGKNEAEFTLQRMSRDGLSSLGVLNGPFVLFTWDDIAAELTVITDRLGRFPVFYCEFANTTVVTTDLHSLFNAGIIAPALHEESIIDFLTIGFPLGEQSLFRGVKRVCGGEVLKISRTGITRDTYWEHRYTNTLDDVDALVDSFQFCVDRAVRRSGNAAVTLSGGWDSRATCSIVPKVNSPVCTVTYGVKESTDAEVAHLVAETLHIPHLLITPEKKFFDSFSDWAQKVISLSNGHATIDLAFQTYIYERLSEQFPAVLDSAGCEFRRGIRARLAARHAKCTEDISTFLTTMYATGIWNDSIINTDFYRSYSSATRRKLVNWLDASPATTFEEQIDVFLTRELWAHHYAHGYPLQTNIIACQMPFSDNEFYDLFLQAVPDIRWTHRFHEAVIRRFAPRLERIPISYGSCRVPYGESMRRYLPVLYHVALSRLASTKPLFWLGWLDNYKPFRPYHRWYSDQLETYVADMLCSTTARGYLNTGGISGLLKAQKHELHDDSHRISILLTFVHLLEYTRSFQQGAPVTDSTDQF